MFFDPQPFLEHLADQDRAAHTLTSYRADLTDFRSWFEAAHQRVPNVAAITPLDIREYRNYLLETKQLKPSTINRRLDALRSYFNWAMEQNVIAANPLRGIKLIAQTKRAPRWLTHPETYALLRAATEQIQLAEAKQKTPTANLARRAQAILALLLHAGLRVSEACVLTQRDVVLKARSGRVTVRQGKGRKYREVPFKPFIRPLDDMLFN